jgi:tetratricopeptide (TPR) repeat protein
MAEKDEAMERFEAGNMHLQESRHKAAMEEYRAAVKANEDFAEAYNNLGLTLFYQDRFDEAIAEYRNALRINPEFAPAHANLGLAFLNGKLTDDAIREFRYALELDADNAEAYYNLGIAYVNKGLIREAIDAYEGFLGHAPERYGNYIAGVRKIVEQLKSKVEREGEGAQAP